MLGDQLGQYPSRSPRPGQSEPSRRASRSLKIPLGPSGTDHREAFTFPAFHLEPGWEITVDGKPRSYRDIKPAAIESAEYLKTMNRTLK
jgi:hypothetical protein